MPSCSFRIPGNATWKRGLFLLPLLCFSSIVLGQQADTSFVADTLTNRDSVLEDSVPGATPFLTEVELIDSLLIDTTSVEQPAPRPVVTSDTIAVFLLRRVENLAITLNELNRQLQLPLDTLAINEDLEKMDEELAMIESYYAESVQQQLLDLRSLNAIASILEEIQARLKRLEAELFRYNQHLISYQTTIEGIEQDSVNRLVPADPSLRNSYLDQLEDLTGRYRRARELLHKRLLELGLMQDRLTRHSIRINDLALLTERQISQIRRQMLVPVHPPLWSLTRGDYRNDFQAVWSVSLMTARDTLLYFLRYNWGIRLVNVGLILFLYIFARINLRKIRRNPDKDASAVLSPVVYFQHYPEISALAAGLTIVPFLYGTPPLVFVEVIWTLLFGLMTWLLYGRLSKSNFRIWGGVVLLFVLNGIIILLMTTTFVERWALLFINAGAVGLGWVLIQKVRNKTLSLGSSWLNWWMTGLFAGMNLLALLLNITGYYHIALTLSYAGTFQLIYAVALWVFIELLGELAYLYIEANKEDLKSYSSWLDYQDLQKSFKRILGVFAVIMWLATFAKSLGVFEIGYEAVSDFLTQARNIGSATFTYGSLLVFILVIYVAVLLSRLLAYLFGNHGDLTASDKKNKLGSTMLLVRVGVLGAGFLLALTAAGISLDKVAIVLGALGVGIGFGLQGLVNNLISGIILAFEKPIKIGDVIELGTFRGKVKEIGIRSSKVVTFDGADVIVPNGDLLSQQLTNWTLSNKSRRIELIVGVGYGSDIPNVREAIHRAIDSQEKVMHYPKPLVLVNDFNDSSVDFRVLFWTHHFDEWISIKSDMMAAVYDELRRSGIEIPFPKRDVFIRFPEKEDEKQNLLPETQDGREQQKSTENGKEEETEEKLPEKGA